MKSVLENLLKPRSVIAFGIYGTFIVLALRGEIEKEVIISIVSVLMGHYFGAKGAQNGKTTGLSTK